MLEVLEFIFEDVFHFLGTAFLLSIICNRFKTDRWQ